MNSEKSIYNTSFSNSIIDLNLFVSSATLALTLANQNNKIDHPIYSKWDEQLKE